MKMMRKKMLFYSKIWYWASRKVIPQTKVQMMANVFKP